MECLVELSCLTLEFIGQTVARSEILLLLALDSSLLALGLLAAGETIVVDFVLEVLCSSLEGLLLSGESVLDVRAPFLEDFLIVLAEIVLRHDGVDLHISDFHFRAGASGSRFLIHLGGVLASRHPHSSHGHDGHGAHQTVFLHYFLYNFVYDFKNRPAQTVALSVLSLTPPLWFLASRSWSMTQCMPLSFIALLS